MLSKVEANSPELIFYHSSVSRRAFCHCTIALSPGADEALSDPGLVFSWLVLWGLSERLTVLRILEPFRRYAESRGPAELDFDQSAPESCIKHHEAFCQLLELAQISMKDFRAGQLSASNARKEIARYCAAAHHSFWIDPDVSFPLGGYPHELQKGELVFSAGKAG